MEESWVKNVTNKSKVDAVCNRKNVTDCLLRLKSLWATIFGKVADNHNLKWYGSTVLSQANAHGCSQLKHQNLGVGGYTRCKVGSHGAKSTCIIGLSVLHRGQPDSGEGCIVYKADQLIASLLSFCSVQSSPAVREFCAAREEHCEPSHGQVCANLTS